jgi:hypothetical protein
MIWSGALMLEFLGEQESADRIVGVIRNTTAVGTLTPDLGERTSTWEASDAIVVIPCNHIRARRGLPQYNYIFYPQELRNRGIE